MNCLAWKISGIYDEAWHGVNGVKEDDKVVIMDCFCFRIKLNSELDQTRHMMDEYHVVQCKLEIQEGGMGIEYIGS